MFDHLDHGCHIKSGKPCVAVGQRALDEFGALALQRRQALEPFAGAFQHTVGDIHSQNACELPLLKQQVNQFPFTAARVEHLRRP